MELVQWHWLVLALILIGLEALGTGGFLVGVAIASFLMAMLVHFNEIGWEWQVICFAIFSMIATTVFWVFFKRSSEQTESSLNDRAAQMVGKTFVLEKDLFAPQDKLQIGDTYWKVASDTDLKKGQRVKVVKGGNMILTIEEIS